MKGQPPKKLNRPLPWTTREILDATRGEIICGDPDTRFAQIGIDSRQIAPEDAYVAIIGDVHDGHKFAFDVVANGIRGLIVNRDKVADLPVFRWREKQINCVSVGDTTKALGDLAAYNRRRGDLSVAAITGSNGKTSTRMMTAAVVGRAFKTLSTSGNLNNQIGLPLTLLKLQRQHRWAILELGTNHPGEIAYLADICSPQIGVITNIGPAHLEGLGSLDGVMQAKGELIEKLPSNGTAVLNADDERARQLADIAPSKVLFYGTSQQAAIKASHIAETPEGISFRISIKKENFPVHLNAQGRFMVTNALAAAAVGHLLGIDPSEIKAGLESFEPAPGRMNTFTTANNMTVIDDAYNANPGSMQAAIATMGSLKGTNRGILIMGDMRELGEQARLLHRQIGAYAAVSGIHRLYVTGEYATSVVEGAHAQKMDSKKIFTGSHSEIMSALKKQLHPEDWILVKGSRSMHMEKIVAGLKDHFGEKSSK